MKPKIRVQPFWSVVITDEFGTHGIAEYATEQEANEKMKQFVDAGQADPENVPVQVVTVVPTQVNPATVHLDNIRIEVRRKWETKQSIISELWINGEASFFGLEPARVNPIVPGHPAIPAGTYKVELSHSPRLGYTTPAVLGVPGRSGIRWHVGNYPKDVMGCLAVGLGKAVDMVLSSKVAFDKLIVILKNAKEITAVYTDPS